LLVQLLAADIPQGTGPAEWTQDLPFEQVSPGLIVMGRSSAGSSRPSAVSGPVMGRSAQFGDIILGKT